MPQAPARLLPSAGGLATWGWGRGRGPAPVGVTGGASRLAWLGAGEARSVIRYEELPFSQVFWRALHQQESGGWHDLVALGITWRELSWRDLVALTEGDCRVL